MPPAPWLVLLHATGAEFLPASPWPSSNWKAPGPGGLTPCCCASSSILRWRDPSLFLPVRLHHVPESCRAYRLVDPVADHPVVARSAADLQTDCPAAADPAVVPFAASPIETSLAATCWAVICWTRTSNRAGFLICPKDYSVDHPSGDLWIGPAEHPWADPIWNPD